MAKIIEFFVPGSFRKKAKWIPPEEQWEGDSVQLAAKEVGLMLVLWTHERGLDRQG
jgi:hypothetical protein